MQTATVSERKAKKEATPDEINKYDLLDKEFKDDMRTGTTKGTESVSKALIDRAKKNTEKQLTAGDDCVVEYVLDNFERVRSNFGDSDMSPDGINVFVQQLPSSIAPWRSYAGRLKRKFGLTEKEAQMAAVIIQYLSDGDWQVKGWFEGYVKMGGFKKAFNHAKHLFWSVYRLEPQTGTPKAKTIAEFMDTSIGEGKIFRALPIAIDEYAEAEMEAKDALRVDVKIENYRMFHDMIRKAGIHQISAVGTKLFNANNDRWFHYEDATSLFEFYRQRKDHLQTHYGKSYRESLAAAKKK